MSRIELKLEGRHWSDTEIQNCYNHSVLISKMAAMLAILKISTAMWTILKIFNCYLLLNGKSGWAKIWWKASGQHGDLELRKSFSSNIQDGHHSSHLENLQTTSAPEGCRIEEKAGGVTWRFRTAKSVPFRYPRGPPWQSFWNSSNDISLMVIGIELKLVGGIWVLWRFRMAKLFLFRYPRWPPWWPSRNSSNHISFQTVSLIELKLDERL